MTCFIASHFMNGVMNCVEVSGFRTFRQIEFTSGCAVFSFYAHFEVFLGAVGNDFAQQFCKFRSMFSFFVSSFFPI